MKLEILVGLSVMLITISIFSGCVENESDAEGLSISNIVFCSDSPMSYMNYSVQPDADYNLGLPVWVYMNVLNHEYISNSNGTFEIWLLVDITVKAPDGSVVLVPGIPADYHGNLSAGVDPEKLFLQYFIPTSGNMSVGKYTVEIIVEDKLVNKTAKASSHFTLFEEFDISNIVFCSDSPMGYMNYSVQPDADYNLGLPVWVYMNVLNKEYISNSNGTFGIWLLVDMTVKAPDGSVVLVPGLPVNYHGNLPAGVDPEKLYLQYYVPTSGSLSVGKYTVEIIVEDKLANKTAKASTNFTLTKKYYNDIFGFSIEQPYGWFVEKRDFGPIVIFFGPREENFSVNILIQVFNGQGMTLNEFANMVKQNDSQILTNYQMVSEQSRIINGLNSYEMVVNHTIEDFDLKLKEVLFLEENLAYMISYTALQSNFDKYSPIFDNIIETFSIQK